MERGRARSKSKDKRKVPGGTGYKQWQKESPSGLDTEEKGYSWVLMWIPGWCHLESEGVHPSEFPSPVK